MLNLLTVISLFNVVTFDNGPCTSVGNEQRHGTCYTAKECQDNGGEAMGNCASG